MKKLLSMLAVMIMMLSLFGCANSKDNRPDSQLADKYDQAVTHLNNKEFNSALALFKELAEEGYQDSAEMVLETKYQFVSMSKDDEDLTVYNYLKELVAENYKDSQSVFDALYEWKFEIAFSVSKQSTYHCDILDATSLPFYYINFRVTGGEPGETLHGQYVITFSNGAESTAGFYDGGGTILSIMVSATENPRGYTTFSLYDDYGNRLAIKSAVIQ